MTTHNVTLIPGDGIGPEVSRAACRVIDAVGVDIARDEVEAGADCMQKFGSVVPEPMFNSIIRNRVALKGPLTTPVGSGFQSANVQIRKRLDLFISLRPVRRLPRGNARFANDNIDIVVVRENSEDLYSGIENLVTPGVVTSIKVITEKACTRLAEWAFARARANGRKKVTAVHKANIMKLSDGLFLECCRKAHTKFREIEYQEMIVDNTCQQLVMRPEQFDVMVMENLYGDIVSDLCAGLIGGLGLSGGANIGEACAVFEAVHGSAPDIAGKGPANPTALIKSSVMMLRHLGEDAAALRIDSAIDKVLADGSVLTGDLGGTAGTDQITDAIIAAL